MALSELTFRCRRDLMEFRSELFLARGAECGLQELTRVSTFGTGKAHGFKPRLSLGRDSDHNGLQVAPPTATVKRTEPSGSDCSVMPYPCLRVSIRVFSTV